MNKPMLDDEEPKVTSAVPEIEDHDAIADDAAEPKALHTQSGGKKPGLNPLVLIGCAAIVLLGAGLGLWRFDRAVFKAPAAKVQDVVDTVKETPKGPLATYARGSIAHLMTLDQRTSITDIAFTDRAQKPLHLSNFKGKVVILNVWATWCGPCRTEMPTLAQLQTQYAGKDLKILPLSVDDAKSFSDVKSFIDVQQPLDVYADQNSAALQAFGIQGMPTTLILDKQGREVARLDGQATWNTPEVRALVDKLLAE